MDLISCIGNTPLISFKVPNIKAKLEMTNPGGSVKDRIALAIIKEAKARGALKPGGVVIEATSGNTGLGLAMVAAALDIKMKICMPSSMSMERRALLRFLGAELILTKPELGMQGAVDKAQELLEKTPNAICANQFENEANVKAHYENTGPEIWRQSEGLVDFLVLTVGTGGTLTGTGTYLREKNPKLKIIAVEPFESPLLSQGKAGPHGIQGIGANFVPKILRRELIDEVMTISTKEAIDTARELAILEGLMVGISSGAAFCAAKRVALANPGKKIITLLPDTAARYLSTGLFADLAADLV